MRIADSLSIPISIQMLNLQQEIFNLAKELETKKKAIEDLKIQQQNRQDEIDTLKQELLQH